MKFKNYVEESENNIFVKYGFEEVPQRKFFGRPQETFTFVNPKWKAEIFMDVVSNKWRLSVSKDLGGTIEGKGIPELEKNLKRIREVLK